jgi:hypothetical protein
MIRTRDVVELLVDLLLVVLTLWLFVRGLS